MRKNTIISLDGKESKLMEESLLLVIKNGNNVNPEAKVPSRDEHVLVCKIFQKLI